MQKQENALPLNLIRKLTLSGFFHFAHALSTILLLLLIGQITGHGDSTKSKILQDFTLHLFHAEHQWTWVIVLLVSKAVFSFARHYTQTLSMHWLEDHLWLRFSSGYHYKTSEKILGSQIKRYAKAIINGRVIWISDLALLLIILIALCHLHFWVAIAWITLLSTSLIFRIWTVRYYMSNKKSWKSLYKKYIQKKSFIFKNIQLLLLNLQLEKEQVIIRKRHSNAMNYLHAFAIQKAWTASFFPFYFFIFLFLLASPLNQIQIESNILLQLILILLYSQSAMIRCFKTPESWKVMKDTHQIWKSNESTISQKESIPSTLFSALHDGLNGQNISSHPMGKLLNRILQNPELFDDEALQTIGQKISFYTPQQPLLGETFIAAVTFDKESATIKKIEKLLEEIPSFSLSSIPWKSALSAINLNDKELSMIQLLKSILHPAPWIAIPIQYWNSITSEEQIWITLQIASHQKKYIVI